MADKKYDSNAFEKDQTQENTAYSRRLRVAIIGCGSIANSHCGSYLRQPDADIVALCDLVPERTREFAEKHGLQNVAFYTDYKEMLAKENLDCVSVCTYNSQHAPCTIAALDAGVNVIVEKPLCVTMDEAKAMMEAEKRSGKVLSIGFQPRFNDNMKKIKEIVKSGTLGDIYYIQTGGGRRRGIPVGHECSFIKEETAGLGALGDIGCYSLDLVLNALDYPKPLTVTGYTSAFFGKSPSHYASHRMAYGGVRYDEKMADIFSVDDFAAGLIRLEGGIVLDFRIAWAMNINTPGDTIILGTKGGLRIPSTDCWNGSLDAPMTIYHEVGGSQVETVIPLLPNNDLWYPKLRSFLDAVQSGGESPVSIKQIVRNQAILDGIVRSAKLGREIEIEIPEV
ncbi:MAG: Gfo/Idh/MocA family oxidoreductase [Clostridia bacterium]|nr:Gfo/Idh/MocA family oxidoreductase [Clostridia bacterium]